MTANIGALQQVDRQAIFDSAQRLGVHPYELGAVINQESGFRPNVHGGAGGNYYGLIQFGPSEQKQYLDPKQINNYSIASQMPAVENFLTGRGYKPGMGVAKLYATILGGNPNASLTSQDAFGTSVSSSLSGFSPGGASYKQAQAVLGDALPSNVTGSTAPPPPLVTPTPQPQPQTDPVTFANSYAARLGDVLKTMATPKNYGNLSGDIDITPLSVKLAQQKQTNTIPIASSDAIISALMSSSGGQYV